MIRTRLIICLLMLFLLQGETFAAPDDTVVAIVSGTDGTHAEVVTALRARLLVAEPALRIQEVDASTVSMASLAGSRIVVTVGSQAARITASLAPPQIVVHTLIPATTYHGLPSSARGGAGGSAIVLDQPAERQIALLRLALPDWRRIALLTGHNTDARVSRLADAARAQQLEVRESRVGTERDLYAALQNVLVEPAILIATPDAQIFSSSTIQNVLLTAYRHRSPVLGFTAAYVRAGALISLYSTPTQIGEQAAELVVRALQGSPLPAVQAPSLFEVAVNTNVARSLGIELDRAEDLTAALVRLEGGKP
ncbi:MAG: hypothetical protein CVU25_04965 [Betaproteobacteria bacterium HGW-Betaproteobacteria-19]|nr:MAG: hypothetical protein CVU25_04965 [Betaproteobacteria bacterium HGW-Betaproteobacteria-19]